MTPNLVFHLPSEVPFTYCRICGDYFSSHNITLRKKWSHKHAQTHSFHQHRMLQASGLHLMPEAAHRLATYGIIPLRDMVLYDEIADALCQSDPIQTRGPPISSS